MTDTNYYGKFIQISKRQNLANDYHLKYILLNDSLQNDKYISQAAAWQAINDINMNGVKYENQLKINEERNKAKIESIANKRKYSCMYSLQQLV